MEKQELLKKLDRLKEPKILVIGDFGIDEMVFGNTQRISREAPVLILEHSKTKIILGTASNAANNIASLNNGKAATLGVYGDDYYAKVLLAALNEKNINVEVIKNLEKAIPLYDGIILSDYHLGFLTENVVKKATELAKKYNKIIVADAQKDLDKYKGATAITPNQPDCEKFVGYFLKDEDALIKAGEDLIKNLELENVLITRGERGMALFENVCGKIKHHEVEAFNRKEVFDVTGAGDTVVAAFTLALCAGFSPYEAMYIGNLAASIVIRYFGCHSVTVEDLKSELENLKGEEIYEIS